MSKFKTVVAIQIVILIPLTMVPSIGHGEGERAQKIPKEIKGEYRENRFRMAKRMARLPLNNPDFIPVAEAKSMKPDDVVFGFNLEGEIRAYPFWVLGQYHVVNDTVAYKDPVVVTLCDACSGASAFKARVPRGPRGGFVYSVCGQGEFGTFQMCDSATESVWHPFKGEAVSGRWAGAKLERIPHLVKYWKDWIKAFPKSKVVNASSDTRNRRHARGQFFGRKWYSKERIKTGLKFDDRLPDGEIVFGIFNPSTSDAKAFLLSDLKKQKEPVMTSLNDRKVMIVLVDEISAVAFYVDKSKKKHSFEVASRSPLLFKDQDGLVWNQFGQLISAKKSARLEMVNGYVTEWFEWSSSHPKTIIEKIK